jgi:lipopolysaccharide assembly outer membrane protein LptD (OstA)
MEYKLKGLSGYLLFLMALPIFILSVVSCSYAAERGSLSADTIQYNTNTKKIKAAGNVVINKEGITLFGNFADGDIGTSDFELKGSVRGVFSKEKAELTAERLKLTQGNSKKNNGKVEAFGNVRIIRNKNDKLDAEYVFWELSTENYAARGNVNAVMQGRVLKAEEAGRAKEKFWGRNVTRYEDKKQKIGFAAKVVDGVIKNGTVDEITASGNVRIDYRDEEGQETLVTGDTAIYSKARGTVVISGNARAERKDGRTVTADNLVLYEETRNIEASGHSQVLFVLPEKDKKKPASGGMTNE